MPSLPVTVDWEDANFDGLGPANTWVAPANDYLATLQAMDTPPFSHYRCNEAVGGISYDYFGNANATYRGSFTLQQVGALADSDDKAIAVANGIGNDWYINNFSLNSYRTQAFWIYLEEDPANPGKCVPGWVDQGSTYTRMIVNADGQFDFMAQRLYAGDQAWVGQTSNTLGTTDSSYYLNVLEFNQCDTHDPNTWHFVVLQVWNSLYVRLYVDGVRQGVREDWGQTINGLGQPYVVLGREIPCRLDEISIWVPVIDADDVLSLYHSGIGA